MGLILCSNKHALIRGWDGMIVYNMYKYKYNMPSSFPCFWTFVWLFLSGLMWSEKKVEPSLWQASILGDEETNQLGSPPNIIQEEACFRFNAELCGYQTCNLSTVLHVSTISNISIFLKKMVNSDIATFSRRKTAVLLDFVQISFPISDFWQCLRLE